MVKKCCVMIILNWREMRVSVVCVIDDGEEMLCDDNSKLKRNARFSCLCNRRWWRNVVWWWRNVVWYSKLKRNARFSCSVLSTMVKKCCVMIIPNWREMCVSVVCVIDGEEMLCDDNSKLKRNARFSCLCNRRWWRNVVWW